MVTQLLEGFFSGFSYQIDKFKIPIMFTAHSLDRLKERWPGKTVNDIVEILNKGLSEVAEDIYNPDTKRFDFGQYLVVSESTGVMVAFRFQYSTNPGHYKQVIISVITLMDTHLKGQYEPDVLEKYHQKQILVEDTQIILNRTQEEVRIDGETYKIIYV